MHGSCSARCCQTLKPKKLDWENENSRPLGDEFNNVSKLTHLIDVGRPNDDELVVHDHQLGVHVDHAPPVLLALLLGAARLGGLRGLRLVRVLHLPATKRRISHLRSDNFQG